jgi:DNA-binding transcriptional MerR regulator
MASALDVILNASTLSDMGKNYISSKEVTKKFEISYPTLTHYTNIGLLRMVGRKGNKRLYDEEGVGKRIPKIRELINRGYPLRLIADMLKDELL